MKKLRNIFLIITLIFILASCKKKEVAIVNMCYINPMEILDNKDHLDIIDEGCYFAKVENWHINCEANKKQKFYITIYDGYYVEGYAFTQTYSLDGVEFKKMEHKDYVEVTPIPTNNYIIFDIREIEE